MKYDFVGRCNRLIPNIDPNEREFAGPSMSVGDLVVLICQGSVTMLQVNDFGWLVVNNRLADAPNADSLFEALPVPEMAVLTLTLSRRA